MAAKKREVGPWGTACREARLAKSVATGENWTKARVAAEAGMTPTTYGKIEAGYPTLTTKLDAVARALGLTPRLLFVDPLAGRGTSYAAPVVAAIIAEARSAQQRADAAAAEANAASVKLARMLREASQVGHRRRA